MISFNVSTILCLDQLFKFKNIVLNMFVTGVSVHQSEMSKFTDDET